MPQYNLHHITPLMMAASSAQPEVVFALAKRGAKLGATDLGGKSVMHYAVVGNLTEERRRVIHLLAYLKRDLIRLADSFGSMPIHLVATQGQAETAQCLIDIDSNAKHFLHEKSFKTPYQIYCDEHAIPDDTMTEILGKQDIVPSLLFTCLQKISKDKTLRDQVPGLPEDLQHQSHVYTPTLTKFLYKKKDDKTEENILVEKLKNLTLR
jgi:ankyrin repeat protein